MTIINRIVREPAALIGLITLGLAAGSIFDVWAITPEQANWILAIVGAAILFLRSYVTPTSDPVLPPGTIVNANTDRYPTATVTANEEG